MKKHCGRYFPMKQKMVTGTRVTALYLGNTEIVVTNSQNRIKKVFVHLSIPKKISLQKHSISIIQSLQEKKCKCPKMFGIFFEFKIEKLLIAVSVTNFQLHTSINFQMAFGTFITYSVSRLLDFDCWKSYIFSQNVL